MTQGEEYKGHLLHTQEITLFLIDGAFFSPSPLTLCSIIIFIEKHKFWQSNIEMQHFKKLQDLWLVVVLYATPLWIVMTYGPSSYSFSTLIIKVCVKRYFQVSYPFTLDFTISLVCLLYVNKGKNRL